MTDKSYDANYQSGLSYLKLNLKEQALDCFNRAYAQLRPEDKTPQNSIYFGVIGNLTVFALEEQDREKAKRFVSEGLKINQNHADLLYLESLLFMDEKRYDEMLEGIIHYLMSLDGVDIDRCDYQYTHPGALDEMYENLLPTAYKGAFGAEAIRDIVARLCKKTGNEWLRKAHEVMLKIDGCRSEIEN